MNDGQYTNLRNYLEEIASTSKQVLEAQKRTNTLLEKQAKSAQPVDDGPLRPEMFLSDNMAELQALTQEQIKALKESDAVGPVTPVATPDPTFDVPPVVVNDAAPLTAAPWPDFDTLSVGQIIARLRKGPDDAAMRARILSYERANRNRDGVIKPLVNWNS